MFEGNLQHMFDCACYLTRLARSSVCTYVRRARLQRTSIKEDTPVGSVVTQRQVPGIADSMSYNLANPHEAKTCWRRFREPS
jgi:hypothetical protein